MQPGGALGHPSGAPLRDTPGGNERDDLTSALTRFFLHGQARWLAPIGGVVPEWFVRFAMSEHVHSVKPWDWEEVAPIWQDWALVYHNVRVAVEAGPQKA